ncbi:hypothetical protein GF357_03350 [Candidatus Dojkabacteria bacterium]|nr:hypothetical protein [Candidatus Dojkabacteria bacterium]
MKKTIDKIAEEIRIRWILFTSSVKYTLQLDTAYLVDGWSNLISTTFYTITFILFIKILYTNINTFAGYSESQTLFLTLIGQINFYFYWVFIYGNLGQIGDLVTSGELDLILTKPVPADFYISVRHMKLIMLIRDSIAPTVSLSLIINWSALEFEFFGFFVGATVLVLGMLTIQSLYFIAYLPVFWLGRGSSPAESLENIRHYTHDIIPFEGFSKPIQIIFTLFIPMLIDTALATSIILGKIRPIPSLLLSLIAFITFTIIKKLLWREALKAYSSASS